MKKNILLAIVAFMCSVAAMAQEGTIEKYLKWNFDGQTLTIELKQNSKKTTMSIPNYDNLTNKAPWLSKKMVRNIKKLNIGEGIDRIGSCAFAGCTNLTDVVFQSGTDLTEIGWGAFMNCTNLHTISFPPSVKHISTVAFANCRGISNLKVPDQCRVEDQAFINCTGIKSLDISPTSTIGLYVFAKEDEVDGILRHSLYNEELRRVPAYMNLQNCHEYGIANEALEKLIGKGSVANMVDYDEPTSVVDKVIPTSSYSRQETYALIIGNQNYRFNSEVSYAIHDARVFAQYCEQTLGIPAHNIHVAEDATKQMINEEEFSWLEEGITDRADKKLIFYYAGHGVPDTKNKNKAYLLPCDVRGTNPRFGIALDDLYDRIGKLGFGQTAIFMDACFSGVNRSNDGVNDGMRAVAIEQEEVAVADPSLVVFSAAQGNETAQGYTEQGHGLFTYYLLQNLQETQGRSTFGELSDYITKNVSETARTLILRKDQTPTTQSSGDNKWRKWSF